MSLEERRPAVAAEPHEGQELLGKDVVLPDVEPRFASVPAVLVARRELAEAAVGDEAELVVVVEDDAPVPGQPEVLQEEVAREDVGPCEVPDRLAEVEDRPPRLFGRRVLEDRGSAASAGAR